MRFGGRAKRSFVTAGRCALASVALVLLIASGAAKAATPTPTYRTDVLSAAPVSFWRLGDTAGTIATDELGANPATYANVTLNQAGAIACDTNAAAAFNGSTSYVTAPSSSSLNMTSAVTMEFWAKRQSISSTYQVLIGKPGDGLSQNENYAVWLSSSNKYQAYFGNGTTYVSVSTPAITDTNWHYIVATDDGSTAKIYLDGVLKQSAATTLKLTANPKPLNLGRANNNQFFFAGSLDEVALYPTALSPTTIQAHYAAATSDLVPPCLSLSAPANGTTSTTSSVTFSGTAGVALGDAATVAVNLYAGTSTSGTPTQTLSAVVQSNGTYTASATLPNGTWTAQTQQQNSAGATGYTAANTFAVNTLALPTPTITSSPPNPSGSTSATFAFSDSASGVAFQCALDNSVFSTCSSPQSYAGLADGSHTFAVEAVDSSGNASPPASDSWTIDTTAPTVTLISPANGDSRAEWPTFSGVAGTSTGDAATVTVKLYAGSAPNGTPLQTLTAPAGSGGVYAVTAAAPLNPGTYTAQSTQTDWVGDAGSSSANTFTVGDPVILAAGSIAACSDNGASRTAGLLSRVPDALVMPLGNNAYQNGQPSEYQNCYDPTWGVAKARTRPAIGQHDDQTVAGAPPAGTGYANYFANQLAPMGPAASDLTKLYYSYDLGAWHVVVLNDSCIDATTPNCDENAQEQWLSSDLAAHSANQCVLAVWNRARWSSDSQVGDRIFIGRFWNILYQYGVDLVLNGATHHYERFAPQDPDGNVDNTYGIREILSAHGGYSSNAPGVLDPNSQVYDYSSYGVLQLTLHPTGYDWKYLPVADGISPAGGSFTDSGSSNCHGAPPPQTLSYHDQVLAASPVSYWRLGETSGTTAADELGANPGTYSHVTLNQPGALSGDPNPSAAFDGLTSAMTVPGSNSLDLTRGATVELWAKRRSTASDFEVLVGKPGDGQSQNENYAVWLSGNTYTAYFGDGTNYVSVATPAITDTNWHYIVATDDGSTAKIYLDGVLQQAVATTLKLTANPNSLNVGHASSNQYFFNGWIDEVAIYPTALSGVTIYNHYNAAPNPPAVSDTVAPTSSASAPATANATSWTVSYTASDNSGGDALTRTDLYARGPTDAAYTKVASDTSTSLSGSFAYAATEGDGTYSFYTTATDQAGNVQAAPTSAQTTTLLDTVAPTSSATAPASGVSGSAMTITYTASDNPGGAGVAKVDLYAEGPGDTTFAQVGSSSSTSGAGSFSYVPAEGPGTYSFYTIATDAAGNGQSAASGPQATTAVASTPLASVAAPASGTARTALGPASAVSSTLSGTTTTATGTLTFTVFGPQTSPPTSCTAGGTTVDAVSVNGSGTYHPSVAFTPPAPGTYWWYASYSGDANNPPASSGCTPAMAATYVYQFASVASAADTSGHNFTTTSSFTIQPNTTYLLLVFRHSASGDAIVSLSSTGVTPSLSTPSFASITSLTYNTAEYQWADWVTTTATASGTGTLTVTFAKTLGAGQITILDLVALGGSTATGPIVTANEGKMTGNSGTASASLPTVPSAQHAGLVFLTTKSDLGASAPTGTPRMANAFYSHQGPGSLGIYTAAPAQQTVSWAIKSQPWGTISLEINHG